MIQYNENSLSGEVDYCLLGIIVSRGKGEKVLQVVSEIGIHHANCILAEGRSAARNRFLELLALEEVDKEIILLGIKKKDEVKILSVLESKLEIQRPHKGIAFTIPVISSGVPMDSFYAESHYRCVMTILNENLVDEFVEFVREKGYSGLTTIKARGAASIMHPLMEMHVESAKELMLMIVHNDRADRLITLITERFNLNAENTGVLAMLPIDKITGIMFKKENSVPNLKEPPLSIAQHMVVSLVPHGKAEEYLFAVKDLGVSGSTIIHSRLVNVSSRFNGVFPFRVDSEEEMVLTLAGETLAHDMRQQLPLLEFDNQVRTPYAISLPVIRTEGMRSEG